MKFIEEIDRKIAGELLLIIGGFMLADTLIRKFAEISNNALPWWILPLLSVLIIMGGVNLKENKETSRNFITLMFLVISITLLVLALNNYLNIWYFIVVGGIWGTIILIWTIVASFKRANPEQ